MSDATGIEWADATWNPVVGCSPVSPGCLNCYAATMARRLEGMGKYGYEESTGPERRRIAEVRAGRAVFTGDVRLMPDRLGDPMRWRKPRRIFVCSMSDLFHEAVSFSYIDRVFAVAALCPQHRFLILTKRPERMVAYLNENDGLTTPVRISEAGLREFGCRPMIGPDAQVPAGHSPIPWPLPNVWLGTSCEDQQCADERIPHLLQCPAAVRFLSCEPLLGPIDLSRWTVPVSGRDLDIDGEAWRGGNQWDRLGWVIVGGESGPKARPCDVEWVRDIVSQCRYYRIAAFVKQLGSRPFMTCEFAHEGRLEVKLNDRKGGDPSEWPDDLRVREMPDGEAVTA